MFRGKIGKNEKKKIPILLTLHTFQGQEKCRHADDGSLESTSDQVHSYNGTWQAWACSCGGDDDDDKESCTSSNSNNETWDGRRKGLNWLHPTVGRSLDTWKCHHVRVLCFNWTRGIQWEEREKKTWNLLYLTMKVSFFIKVPLEREGEEELLAKNLPYGLFLQTRHNIPWKERWQKWAHLKETLLVKRTVLSFHPCTALATVYGCLKRRKMRMLSLSLSFLLFPSPFKD